VVDESATIVPYVYGMFRAKEKRDGLWLNNREPIYLYKKHNSELNNSQLSSGVI
jgi:hypothetical protein